MILWNNFPVQSFQPPLLVQRCNGTTAGLGYLEVNVIHIPIWLLFSVRTVDPHWGVAQIPC
jgi:hypothetical protein